MAYTTFVDERGESYFVDWDTVYRILRAHHLAAQRAEQARVVRSVEPGIGGWFLPAIESIEVPWDRVRAKAIAAADADFDRLSSAGVRDMRTLRRALEDRTRRTEQLTAKFRDLMAATQTENMVRMNQAVDRTGLAIDIARFLRDTSAEGLVIGSTLLTGGAAAPALAALGGGSALKGMGKYQDSGNAGAALVTGTGTFMFGLFKVGGNKLNVAEEVTVTIVQAQWESMNALVEGKSMTEALAKGGAKLTGPLVDRLTKIPAVMHVIGKAAAPLNIALNSDSARNIAPELLRKTVSKIAQKTVDAGAAKLAKGAAGSSGGTSTDAGPGSATFQSATLTEGDILLNLAIISERGGLGNFGAASGPLRLP